MEPAKSRRGAVFAATQADRSNTQNGHQLNKVDYARINPITLDFAAKCAII
jgi:hypothetical protein